MTKADDTDPAVLIDDRIRRLDDWRGAALARIRKLIHQAEPGVTETWKWRGVPVWECDGIICTGESYRDKIKLTFARGAALDDPTGLFNASMDGKTRRAIDIGQGDSPDAAAFKALVRRAVKANREVVAKRAKPAKP